MTERTIIVGAGVIGAALAYRLSLAGIRVTVIDAEAPAFAASGRSFGWINASFYLDHDHFALRQAAMEAFHALATDLGPTGAAWCGAINWEEVGEAQEATATALEDLGYPLRRIGRAAFRRLEPAVADAPEEALLFPSEGAVDLADLTRRLLAGAGQHGARFCFGLPVQEIRLAGGRVSGVATPDGVLQAERVVIAAGTGAPALIAPLGLQLPMLRRPALILRTAPVAPLIGHILASPGQELRQEPDGRILAPTSAGHQSDDASEIGGSPERLAEAAVNRLRAMLPGVDLRLEQVMRAFRPVPGDGFPVAGQTAVDGLWLAIMHSGATLAPLMGALLAREIVAGDASPLLRSYRPARFA